MEISHKLKLYKITLICYHGALKFN
jgi:hypothetical protein